MKQKNTEKHKNNKILKILKKKLEATVQVRNYTNKQIKIKKIKLIKSQKKYQNGHNFCYFYLKFRILKHIKHFSRFGLQASFFIKYKSNTVLKPYVVDENLKTCIYFSMKIKYMKIYENQNK